MVTNWFLALFFMSVGVSGMDVVQQRVHAVIDRYDVSKMSTEKKEQVSKWIVKYSRKWHVDPVLLACVAARESNFRQSPPPLKYCKNKVVGDSVVQVCKPRRLEEGMLQSIPRQRVTREGYWYCFGKSLKRREQLRDRETSICVGAYELSSCKLWVNARIQRRKGIRGAHQRHRKYLSNIVAKYGKEIVQLFWAAGAYNWGPRILKRNRGRYDNIGYPIRVMRCYTRYAYLDVNKEKNRAVAERDSDKKKNKAVAEQDSGKERVPAKEGTGCTE